MILNIQEDDNLTPQNNENFNLVYKYIKVQQLRDAVQ